MDDIRRPLPSATPATVALTANDIVCGIAQLGKLDSVNCECVAGWLRLEDFSGEDHRATMPMPEMQLQMTREQAEKHLFPLAPGRFVVRNSSKEGCVAIESISLHSNVCVCMGGPSPCTVQGLTLCHEIGSMCGRV